MDFNHRQLPHPSLVFPQGEQYGDMPIVDATRRIIRNRVAQKIKQFPLSREQRDMRSLQNKLDRDRQDGGWVKYNSKKMLETVPKATIEVAITETKALSNLNEHRRALGLGPSRNLIASHLESHKLEEVRHSLETKIANSKDPFTLLSYSRMERLNLGTSSRSESRFFPPGYNSNKDLPQPLINQNQSNNDEPPRPSPEEIHTGTRRRRSSTPLLTDGASVNSAPLSEKEEEEEKESETTCFEHSEEHAKRDEEVGNRF
ncbi:hypothetical protein F4678DRAFT_458365 [Xylaria arbuscula]|nr:hypothetical protein F4678DRAFT_458365 [Xylaria arbuscula]